ncbi:DUF3558 domain-containing protein [Aldersonia sp. NBC_00410]|uniref:DUF3558 family protein n=1 Tax=Aldersonia sp. NBC_00410 TaxID=2975954 RepID=UPI002255B32B|nr:DUF3558 family protein [Aldersonia sp. NBC_00410]MCX5042215.1 DUF3558 domain-containing protein [Aldersonia sp. NBC_00410]
MAAVLAVAVSGFVATGCSTTAASQADSDLSVATSSPKPPARAMPLWDPCSIPGVVVDKTGVELGTETPDFVGMPLTDAKTCGWSASNYDLVVYSTHLMPNDIQGNPHFRDIRSVVVANRPALMFGDDFVATNSRSCNLAFPIYQGATLVSLVTTPSTRAPKEDACVTLTRDAAFLVDELPR